MAFDLSNVASIFMRLINQILQPFLNQFIVVYFDDIAIYSSFKEDHLKHIPLLLTTLQENELQINIKKCEFLCYSIHFSRFIRSFNGIFWIYHAMKRHKVSILHAMIMSHDSSPRIVACYTECYGDVLQLCHTQNY